MEQDPEMTRVTITLDFPTRDLPQIIGTLARVSEATQGTGQLDLGLANQVDRALLAQRVTLHDLRRYYDEEFIDDTPSAIATAAFREIGLAVSNKEKVTDRQGHAIEIYRKPWEVIVGGILAIRQEGPIRWGPGSKKKRLISEFQAWLPPAEAT